MADRTLFPNTLGLVFGLNGDRFPPELHADRASFTAGKFDGWDSAKMRGQVPALREQLRVHLSWLDQCVAGDRKFLLGNGSSLADLAVYHPLWYARSNLGENEGLAMYPRVLAWMDRVEAVGHGMVEEMSPEQALAIARDAQPVLAYKPASQAEADWSDGELLSVTPVDWGFDAVVGTFVSAGPDSIALRRDDPDIGTVIIHFPRAGFAIARV